jgi:ribosomal protein S18 acetylase RimI-like enzyme
MIEVVPALLTHVGPIATRMREIDQKECRWGGHDPKTALRLGLRSSMVAFTVKINGRPEAMFGVVTTNFIYGEGSIWMLLTDDGAKQSRALVRLGRIYTAAFMRHWNLLRNHVHADNHKAIRWLSRLGFVVGPVDVIRGEPMREFSACTL